MITRLSLWELHSETLDRSSASLDVITWPYRERRLPSIREKTTLFHSFHFVCFSSWIILFSLSFKGQSFWMNFSHPQKLWSSSYLLKKVCSIHSAWIKLARYDSFHINSFVFTARKTDEPKHSLTESQFRFMHNEDAMAVEKLAEGIRKFAEDTVKLEAFIKKKMQWTWITLTIVAIFFPEIKTIIVSLRPFWQCHTVIIVAMLFFYLYFTGVTL